MKFENIDDEWKATVSLDRWTEFWGYPVTADIAVGGDSIVEEVKEIHEQTGEYVLSHQEQLLRNMLQALYSDYNKMQEEYGYDPEEKDIYMPDISSVDDLKDLIKLNGIYIIDVERDGLCYVGFHFECTWDDEHDLGFMTYKTDVVTFGDSDCAFLTWIAEEDREKNM